MSIFYSENTSARTSLPASGITDTALILDVLHSGSEKSLSLSELKKTGIQVINVVQLGADPLGIADSTAAFQAAILSISGDDVASQKTGVIYAPRGKYKITSTLDFGTLRGWTLLGDGGDTIPTATTTYKAAGTRIFWAGANGGTMMRADGSYFRIEGIGLFGAPIPNGGFAQSANRAGYGFILGYTAGIGSGGALVDDMRITDCEIGWQNGDEAGDGNCGDMVFRSMEFAYCGVGMKTVNDQGLNYIFDYLNSTGNSKTFLFERGGGLYVGMMHSIITPIVLELGAVGAETATYTFGYVKFDATQGGTPRLLNMTDTSITAAANVIFQSIRAPTDMYDSTTPLFRVVGNTRLVVQNCTYLHPATTIVEFETGTANFYPTAVFEGCMIDSATTTPPVPGWNDSPSFVKIIDMAAAQIFTADHTTDTFELPSLTYDTFFNWEQVRVSGASLPSGLVSTTDYYIVNRDYTGNGHFRLSTTSGVGAAAVSISTNGSGTMKVYGTSPYSNNIGWVFKDCSTNGLNIPLPTIGLTKQVYDPSENLVNMRFKNRLICSYSGYCTLNYLTNNETADIVEVYCNNIHDMSSATGANRFLLSGSSGWGGGAYATFQFRRRNGQWYEISRTIY